MENWRIPRQSSLLRAVTSAVFGAILLLALVGCLSTPAGQHNSDADNLSRQGRLGEAIVRYSEAIRLAPTLTIAYSGRAAVYNALGQYELAIQDADQAISLEPWVASAYNHKGLAFL